MGRLDVWLSGYLDFQQHTPWKRSPMTEEEWLAAGIETLEQYEYWQGFKAAGEDAFYKTQRKRQQREHADSVL